MEKIAITTYRGFKITLDLETGKFSAWNDRYDTEFAKGSLNAIKKGVDEYLKSNAEFKPFKVQKALDWSGKHIKSFGAMLIVSGIRKDGALVAHDRTGKQKLITKGNVSCYILYQEHSEDFNRNLDKLTKEFEEAKRRFELGKRSIFDQVTFKKVKDMIPELMEQMGYDYKK